MSSSALPSAPVAFPILLPTMQSISLMVTTHSKGNWLILLPGCDSLSSLNQGCQMAIAKFLNRMQ